MYRVASQSLHMLTYRRTGKHTNLFEKNAQRTAREILLNIMKGFACYETKLVSLHWLSLAKLALRRAW